ncbi:Low temperature viability protein [Obba rivulosa]|uniref:Low temperature viability protein n=1 Tax=Obba rivulosa TaxID=1052685 RepID=A0A8E2AVQ2_9APHY|nr:Low temperature viability protein [Obba rivulosa]
MPPKSIFRQPGAKHFQVVHRSQRDPLIHDPEASQHVLKEVHRANLAKGKSRAELEQLLSPSDLAHDKARANIGEASIYGVYFDDTDYDYMQHLRPVGVQEDGVESVLIEGPTKAKGKGKSKDPIELLDLPSDTLPSVSELPRNYESQQAIPSSIAGFQPDMDPHLRQVLEALEDDAFVDGDLEDDFFEELVAEGERGVEEPLEFEFREEGVDEEDEHTSHLEQKGLPDTEGKEENWEARFARFKREQRAAPPSDGSDLDAYSEAADTVGTLPQFSVIGGKKRRKGASDASGYSMSSSSMFRNDGLTTLDERFDQIQKQYESDEEDEDEGAFDSTEEAPELITSREDFEAIMNEFLDNYEIVGGKMRAVLAGETGADKLETIRKGLGQAHLREQEEDESEENDILMPLDIDKKQDRWDCDTILTTYSNLENHPRLIRARQERPVPKIRLDPKTGLPVVQVQQGAGRTAKQDNSDESSDSESGDAQLARVTVTRPKNETKEDKKARKQAVKAERQARRVSKKAMKEQFTVEARQQSRTIANKETTKLRKL